MGLATNSGFLVLGVIFLAIILSYDIEFLLEGSIGSLFEFRFRTSQYIENNKESRENNILESYTNYQRIAIVDGHGANAPFTYMKHIREMFENMGYQILTKEQVTTSTKWDVMWYHDYSFSREPFSQMIKNSDSKQIINHVPGSGYYTSKVALATCGLKFGVPEAFEMPSQREKLLEFAESNPDTLWVQKDNNHRNIKILKIGEMDLTKNNSFVQKFVDNPLLIDNRKFDIGIYTVVTSLLPLKVYIYDGDVLIRFCPEDYHPFDVNNVDKYVVGDEYTPIWEIESLSNYFNVQKMSFKHTIDSYLGTKSQDSSKIWQQIVQIIGDVFRTQQHKMLIALQGNQFNAKYFELSRFDFVVDEDLKVFLMEANMSPNLSSGHFKQNQILYEKVLMSVFSLIGIGQQLQKHAENELERRESDQNPLVNDRDINLPLKFCVENKCEKCDEAVECQLCGHCMTPETRRYLSETFLENINRRQMKRIEFDYQNYQPLTKEDHLLNLWLQTKCNLDNSWC